MNGPQFPGLEMKKKSLVIFGKVTKRREKGFNVNIKYVKKMAKKLNIMEN